MKHMTKYPHIGFRADPKLVERLQREARRQKMSVGALIKQILAAHLEGK